MDYGSGPAAGLWANVRTNTAPRINANPAKSAGVKEVLSQNTEIMTADIGSTRPMMLPFKGPIMLTP